MSYWFRSGILTILSRGSTLFFNLFAFIILIRFILTKEEFGIWSIYFAFISLLEVARNGLIKNAFIRYNNIYSAGRKGELFKSSLLINLLFSVVTYIALLIFSDLITHVWKAPQLKMMLTLYGFSALALIPLTQFEFLQQSNLSFKGVTIATITRNVSFFICTLTIAIVKVDSPLTILVIAQALSITLASAVSYLYTKKFIQTSGRITRSTLKRLVNFGKYTLATNFGSMVYGYTDQLMLGAMVSQVAVAIYNLAIKINSLAQVPSMAMAEISFPKSVNEKGGKEGKVYQKYLYEKSVGVVIALILPVLVVVLLFPKIIINVIGGQEYSEAAVILQLTIFYILFMPFSRQFGVYIESSGNPRLNSLVELSSAVLNIVLNFFFIKYYGIKGACYATILARLIKLIIHVGILKRMLSISIINIGRFIMEFYLTIFKKIRLVGNGGK